MDNHITQLQFANRKVAYLITNTHLEVIDAGGDYSLLHTLVNPSRQVKKRRTKPAKQEHSTYVKRQIVDLVPELDSHKSVLQQMLKEEGTSTQTLRINRAPPVLDTTTIESSLNNPPPSTTLFFDIMFSPKRDLAGHIEGAVFLIEDTTASCLMQLDTQQLKNGKQLLQDQLDMIAHELGAPLTIIAGYVELLHEVAKTQMETEHQQYLDLISSKVDHLHVVLKNLFNMAYVESDNLRLVMQPINIVNLIYNVVAEMHPRITMRGQQVNIKTDGEEEIVTCDRLHIGQALSHLLDNASKFSPQGGTIEVTISSNSRPGYIHMAIIDSGAGILGHERDSIFQRFYRTKFANNAEHGGIGLGLYTARRMVEIHKGEIWCDNAPGSGSVFHIMLPLGKKSLPQTNMLNQQYENNLMQIYA